MEMVAKLLTGLIPVYAPMVAAIAERYAPRIPYVGAVGLGIIGAVLADQAVGYLMAKQAVFGPAWAAAAGAGAEGARQFWKRVEAALPKK